MTETHPQNRLLGYARVSTVGQTLDSQLEQLRGAGCTKIYREKVTGARAGRRQLLDMLKHLAPGDAVTVTRIDRLARSTFDLFAIVKQIVDAKAQFRSLAEPWADTGTSTGRLMLAVLGGLADVERDLIRTRTAEGRSRAQKRGQHMGRPPKLTEAQQAEARKRRAEGATLVELARSYGVGEKYDFTARAMMTPFSWIVIGGIGLYLGWQARGVKEARRAQRAAEAAQEPSLQTDADWTCLDQLALDIARFETLTLWHATQRPLFRDLPVRDLNVDGGWDIFCDEWGSDISDNYERIFRDIKGLNDRERRRRLDAAKKASVAARTAYTSAPIVLPDGSKKKLPAWMLITTQ